MERPVLNISPKFIKSVASIYTDINRVFMEYIDNSFDSAEAYFEKASNSYNKPIRISIEYQGTTCRDAKLKIKDNCKGISEIKDITYSIGNSKKAGNRFLNGQFGFGIYSFLAVCDTIKISTKVAESNSYKMIQLDSKMFDKTNVEEVVISSIFEGTRLRNDGSSYTNIVLSDFDEDKFTELSLDILKSEIEKHFEIHLARTNLLVTISDQNNVTSVCRPFDYSSYSGPEYTKTIDTLEYTHSKRYNTLKRIDISEKPIKVYLKVTQDKALERKPFFVLKDRRISEVSNVKAFNSYSKGFIWSHPNVTGYIDISDLLEPTLSRTEFKNTLESRALFQTLLKLESEIKIFIEESVNRIINSRFKKLESILSNALRNLAIEDSIRRKDSFREGMGNISNNTNDGDEQIKGFNVYNNHGGEENNTVDEDALSDEYIGTIRKRNQRIPDEVIELPEKVKEIKSRRNNQKDNSIGLNIKIDFENEPLKDADDKPIRSVLSDTELLIYKKHPEFSKRLDDSIHGIPKITSSLINYLCSEILLHYKSATQMVSPQTMDNKSLFNDFLESLYFLENQLSWLKNKRISEFS